MPRKPTEDQSLGDRILASIRNVLQRCEEVGERLDFPGEGGERRFRAWLNSDLLQQGSAEFRISETLRLFSDSQTKNRRV